MIKLLNKIERWIAYRTYDRYHYIRVDGMEPGYSDKDNQMLGAMFGLLVDYVECELAHMQQIGLPGKRSHRSRELGIEHLDWEIGLIGTEDMGFREGEPGYMEPMSQSISAREQKELYLWWKDVRPNRPDPGDASDWNEIWERERGTSYEDYNNHSKEYHAAAMRSNEIEEEYHGEDDAMLVRLVGVRRSMWT